MKVKNIGANQTEIQTARATILVSYETPVCANVDGKFYRTSQNWSRTTSKHINNWLDGRNAELKEQSFFDSILGCVDL